MSRLLLRGRVCDWTALMLASVRCSASLCRALLLLSALAVFAAIPLCGQSSNASASSPRIVETLDTTSLTPRPHNTPPFAQPAFDRGPAPLSMPANRLVLVLSRSAQQEADLQTYLESVQNVNSPNYHKFL